MLILVALLLPLNNVILFGESYTIYRRHPDGIELEGTNQEKFKKSPSPNNFAKPNWFVPQKSSITLKDERSNPSIRLDDKVSDSPMATFFPSWNRQFSTSRHENQHLIRFPKKHPLKEKKQLATKLIAASSKRENSRKVPSVSALGVVTDRWNGYQRKIPKQIKIIKLPQRRKTINHDIIDLETITTTTATETTTKPKDGSDSIWVAALKEILIEFKKKMQNSSTAQAQANFLKSNSIESPVLNSEFRRRKPASSLIDGENLPRIMTSLSGQMAENKLL